MKRIASVLRRIYLFILLLPETCANSLRFRVFFVLPRWFRVPASVYLSKRPVILRFPDEEGVDADFIACFLRNDYGLGHKLGEVRTILDVGANLGFFSLAAREHYPRATIHAYEPNPRIQPELCGNTAGLNIQVFAEAVGNRDGYVKIIDTGPSNQARTRISKGSTGGMPQVTLATAIERIGGSVDLLKLDCEGAEWEILTLRYCWKSVRNIRLEYHLMNGETPDQAIDALMGCGFEIIHLRRHGNDSGILWARQPGCLP